MSNIYEAEIKAVIKASLFGGLCIIIRDNITHRERNEYEQ